MLQIFRRNLFVNSLLLLPYIVLIRFKSFSYDLSETVDLNSLYLSDLPSWNVSTLNIAIFSSLLVFFQALMINRMSIKNSYDRNLSLFPGLFYIVFVSILPEYLLLSPALIANTFVIIALGELNKLYKKHMAAGTIFNIGFYAIISILFYFPYIFLIPVYVIGIYSLRAQNLKEFIQFLSGIFVVLFLSYSYYFINLKGSHFIEYFQSQFFNFNFGKGNLSVLIAFAFLILALIGMRRGITIKKAIQVVKKLNLFYWIIFFSFLLPLIGSNSSWTYKLMILSIPFGILTGLIMANSKNRFIPELIHLVLLAIIINNQYDLLSLLK